MTTRIPSRANHGRGQRQTLSRASCLTVDITVTQH